MGISQWDMNKNDHQPWWTLGFCDFLVICRWKRWKRLGSTKASRSNHEQSPKDKKSNMSNPTDMVVESVGSFWCLLYCCDANVLLLAHPRTGYLRCPMSPAARSLSSNSSLDAGGAVCHGNAMAYCGVCSMFTFFSGQNVDHHGDWQCMLGVMQIDANCQIVVNYVSKKIRKMDIVRRETLHGHGSLFFFEILIMWRFEHDGICLQSTKNQGVIPGDWWEMIGCVVMSGDDISHHMTWNKPSLFQGLARHPPSQTDDFCDWQSYIACSAFFLERIPGTIYL